ncbi:FtsK/SpoIIIE domain-containing protein [Niallia alba]|uniref:FtsK/SpoIIIE domain-containing protein n=1 Tax=Niallia alba TaxID=2729105 RepID=UPI0039A34757
MKNDYVDFVEVNALSKTPYRNRISSLLMLITLLVFIVVFLDSKLAGFFSLVLTILFFIALVLIVKEWIVARLAFNRSPFRRLKQFILVNKLYDEETREFGKDKKQRKKVIVNSACFEFLVTDTELIIRALKNGDKYTDKANTYDSMLSALFGLELSNKVENINYCEYIFKTEADERLIVVRENELEYNQSTIIPLNSNIGWDIQKFPHALIAGATGGGKTTFLNFLIIEILKMHGELLIVDPKHSDLYSLHFYLGKERVAGEPNQIARVVRTAKEIMDARFKEYKGDSASYGKNYRHFHLPPVFIIVDELGALRMGAEKKVFSEIMSNLQEVILKGREMGVFVILATQQPNAQNIPTEVRDNLSLRVSLGNLSKEGERMAFGGIDGDLPTVEGKGSGYIFLDGMGWNNPKSFQAPFLDYEKFNFVDELQKYANIAN